jgi:hypothetical protein
MYPHIPAEFLLEIPLWVLVCSVVNALYHQFGVR